MTPLAFVLVVLALSVAAGLLGSLVGVGGGIIVVPALTLLLHIDIRFATGATIISVIATSSGAAAVNARGRMTNLRLAMVLCTASVAGALAGAYFAGLVAPRGLYVIFGTVMGLSALFMLRSRRQLSAEALPRDSLADWLRLHSSYFDSALRSEVGYRVTGARIGLGLMVIAGAMSGLLGIGSGVLKVPTMDLAMRLPIKVSSATTNFMIGITAAASAGVYFARGQIDPFVAAPVACGVLVGATAGSVLLGRLQSSVVRTVFVIVLLWVSLEMLLKGAR